MSRTSDILNRALQAMRGVTGQIILEDIRQSGLKRDKVEAWVKKLRNAADILEELIK